MTYLSHADVAVAARVGVALEVDGEDVTFEGRRAVLLVVAEHAAVRAVRFENDEIAHRCCPIVEAFTVDRLLNLRLTLEQLERFRRH